MHHPWVARLLRRFVGQRGALEDMAAAARVQARPDAVARIVDLAEDASSGGLTRGLASGVPA